MDQNNFTKSDAYWLSGSIPLHVQVLLRVRHPILPQSLVNRKVKLETLTLTEIPYTENCLKIKKKLWRMINL